MVIVGLRLVSVCGMVVGRRCGEIAAGLRQDAGAETSSQSCGNGVTRMYQDGATAPLFQVEPCRRAIPDPTIAAAKRLIDELSELAAIIDPVPEDVEVVVRTVFNRGNASRSAPGIGLR
jgi:hypothetical protein